MQAHSLDRHLIALNKKRVRNFKQEKALDFLQRKLANSVKIIRCKFKRNLRLLEKKDRIILDLDGRSDYIREASNEIRIFHETRLLKVFIFF